MDQNVVAFTGKMVNLSDLNYVGDNAKAVLRFRFRVYNGKYKDQHRSVFLNAECWGPHAEYLANKFAELQGKGVELKNIAVAVSGRYEVDEWEKDGQKREAPKVANANVVILNAGDGVPF
jgi:single-stranded DNA-binding protein